MWPFEAALREEPLAAAMGSGDARRIAKVRRNARWQGRRHDQAIELARQDLTRRRRFMTPVQSTWSSVSWASREHLEWFWKCVRPRP